MARLEELFGENDPAPYGRYLFQQVFVLSKDAENDREGILAQRLRELLRASEDANAAALRLRLEISLHLPQLHALAWETMLASRSTCAISSAAAAVISSSASSAARLPATSSPP